MSADRVGRRVSDLNWNMVYDAPSMRVSRCVRAACCHAANRGINFRVPPVADSLPAVRPDRPGPTHRGMRLLLVHAPSFVRRLGGSREGGA